MHHLGSTAVWKFGVLSSLKIFKTRKIADVWYNFTKIGIIKSNFFGPLKSLDNYLSESKKIRCCYAPFGSYICLKIVRFVNFKGAQLSLVFPSDSHCVAP